MSKLEIPEDVKNLNLMVQKLSAFRRIVSEAMFSGKESKIVSDLKEHLMEEYTQVFEKFNTHPYVVAQLAAQEKQEKEDQALAAEIEKDLVSKMEIK
jgi:superoxide dismutase